MTTAALWRFAFISAANGVGRSGGEILNPDEQRKQFEAWFKDSYPNAVMLRMEDGDRYTPGGKAQSCWKSWQAGRSSLLEENARLREVLGGICGSLRNSNLRYELVRNGAKLAEWKAKAEALLEEARAALGKEGEGQNG